MAVSLAARFEQGRHAVIARILEKIEVARPAGGRRRHACTTLHSSSVIRCGNSSQGRARTTAPHCTVAAYSLWFSDRDISPRYSYSVSL